MNFVLENLYHIYNQGNNRESTFLCDDDYIIFLRLIKRLISPHCEILAWCLMPNHFHLMVYIKKDQPKLLQGNIELDPLSNGIRKLLSNYARIFNKKYNRSGSLFRQKTKANNLSDTEIRTGNQLNLAGDYLNCFLYVHQNPVKAGLVKNLKDWAWSSYRDYAGLRNGTLCNKELAFKFCDINSV